MASRRQSLQTPAMYPSTSNYMRNLSPGPSSSSQRSYSPSRLSPTRLSPAPPLSSLVSSSPLSNYVNRYGSCSSSTAKNYLVMPFYTPPSRSRSLVNRISNRIAHSEVLRNLPPLKPVKSLAQIDREAYVKNKNDRRLSDIGPRICISDDELDDVGDDDDEYEDEDEEDEEDEEWEDEEEDENEREYSPEIVTKVPQTSKTAIQISRTIPNYLKKIPENASLSPPKIQAPPRVFIDQIKPTEMPTSRSSKPPTMVARDLACREKTPAPMGKQPKEAAVSTSSKTLSTNSSSIAKAGISTTVNNNKSQSSSQLSVPKSNEPTNKLSPKVVPPVSSKHAVAKPDTSIKSAPVNATVSTPTASKTIAPSTSPSAIHNAAVQQKPSTLNVKAVPSLPEAQKSSSASVKPTLNSPHKANNVEPKASSNSNSKVALSSDKPSTSGSINDKPSINASKVPQINGKTAVNPALAKPRTSITLQLAAEKLAVVAASAEEEEDDEDWEDEEWEDEEEEFSDPEDAKAFQIVHELIQKYQDSLQYGGASTAYGPVSSNQRIVSSGVASVSSHLNGATQQQQSNGQHSSDNNYKQLYEQQKSENEKLRKKIEDMNSKSTESLPNGTSRIRAVQDDEKKVFERKIQQLEYELENSTRILNDNMRLKTENDALIRVLSKLSRQDRPLPPRKPNNFNPITKG